MKITGRYIREVTVRKRSVCDSKAFLFKSPIGSDRLKYKMPSLFTDVFSGLANTVCQPRSL